MSSLIDNYTIKTHSSNFNKRRAHYVPLSGYNINLSISPSYSDKTEHMMINPPGEFVTKIIPNLFLGDGCAAIDQNFIYMNNIKLIINCANDCHTPEFIDKENTFTYVHFKIIDHSDAPIKDHIHEAVILINLVLSRGQGVLVHCKAGVSRSATFVIAYLMKYGTNIEHPKSMERDEAFTYVKERRPLISPNFGFGMILHQLNEENGFTIGEEFMI